jgi:hypothetical protein
MANIQALSPTPQLYNQFPGIIFLREKKKTPHRRVADIFSGCKSCNRSAETTKG